MNRVLKYLFLLFLLVFPFGQLLRIDLTNFIPGVRVQSIDLAAFLLVIFWVGKKIKKKEKIIFPPLSKELLVFGFIAFLSLLIQVGRLKGEEFLGSFFYFLRLVNFIVFFIATTEVLKKEKLPIFSYLIAEGVVIALFSLLQYLFLPDTRFLFYIGWDEHYFRAIGSFFDPGFTGLLLVLAFIVWLACLNSYKDKKKYLYWLAGFILLLAIGLSFSRLAYVSLLAGLASMFLVDKKRRLYLFAGVVLLVIVFFLPKPGGEGVNLFRLSSFVARADAYKQSFKIAADHFWTGVGFNAFRYAQRDYGFISEKNWGTTNAGAGTDNSFLFVLATTGIFGLLTYLYFWLKCLYMSFKNSTKNKSSLILFASMISLSVSALVINSLFYPWIMGWLMTLLAKFTVDNEVSTEVQSCFAPGPDKQF